MKLKNNDPGKIWAKSDHWFKSYGHFCHPIPALGWVRLGFDCSANLRLLGSLFGEHQTQRIS